MVKNVTQTYKYSGCQGTCAVVYHNTHAADLFFGPLMGGSGALRPQQTSNDFRGPKYNKEQYVTCSNQQLPVSYYFSLWH